MLREPWSAFDGPDHHGIPLNDPFLDAAGRSQTFIEETRYPMFLGQVTSAEFMRKLFVDGGPVQGREIANEKVDAIRSLLTGLVDQGLNVVVVDMPVTADFVSYLPQGTQDYQRSSAAIEQVTKESGATYVDAGIWDTSLFCDPIHVNDQGSARFGQLVAPHLRP